MDCSLPGFPVHHQLPELAQPHVRLVSDAIHPSHPLFSLSPLSFNLSSPGSFPMSQFFSSGGQSIGVSASTSVLPMNIQDCKLEVVKEEMARVNINILGIREQRWTGMGEFNSDDHYIYYCGQESLRRNRVAIIINKRA